jgi:hypothetical protein
MDPRLIPAIISVESGGDDSAIGDKGLAHKAYGPMQIRQPVCDDVNRVYGGKIDADQMLGNRILSIDTFEKYIAIYCTLRHLGHTPNDQDRARCWNGGPAGPWENATLGYWKKVQAAMIGT